MKIFYGLEKIGKFKRPVVALGVFDGVHRGHRYILKQAVKKARQIDGTSIALTFDPHPQAKGMLYSLKHRLNLIAQLGLDACIVIKFTHLFAKISAQQFLEKILSEKIKAKFIYAGKNFRFGKNAKGDFKLLKKLSVKLNYKLKEFSLQKINHQPISSTYIRKLVLSGDLKTAQKFLLAPVTVLGTVVRGISLARKIGFPTANINPHHEILPASGVYAVKVILGGKIFGGICNIGKKPTVIFNRKEEEKEKNIEVHIFGFKKNIYGKQLQIQFLKKIREEAKFASLALLALQIKKDVLISKRIISRH